MESCLRMEMDMVFGIDSELTFDLVWFEFELTFFFKCQLDFQISLNYISYKLTSSIQLEFHFSFNSNWLQTLWLDIDVDLIYIARVWIRTDFPSIFSDVPQKIGTLLAGVQTMLFI